MIIRKIVETYEKYDKDGKLLEKTVKETNETELTKEEEVKNKKDYTEQKKFGAEFLFNSYMDVYRTNAKPNVGCFKNYYPCFDSLGEPKCF